jgi:hypothetical protein
VSVPIRVMELSVAIDAIFRALRGMMPCHPSTGRMPTNSIGQNVIFTASQFVPQPVSAATMGMMA